MRGSRWAALALAACVIAAPPLAAQPRTPAQMMAYQNALRQQQQQMAAYQNALRLQQQQQMAAYQNALRQQQQAKPVAAHQIPQANGVSAQALANSGSSRAAAFLIDWQQRQQAQAKIMADALAIQQGQAREIATNPGAYSAARIAQIQREWQANSLLLQREDVYWEAGQLASAPSGLPPAINAQLHSAQQRLAALNAALQKLGVGSSGGGGGGDGCAAAAGAAASGGAAAGGDGGGCGGSGCGSGGDGGD